MREKIGDPFRKVEVREEWTREDQERAERLFERWHTLLLRFAKGGK